MTAAFVIIALYILGVMMKKAKQHIKRMNSVQKCRRIKNNCSGKEIPAAEKKAERAAGTRTREAEKAEDRKRNLAYKVLQAEKDEEQIVNRLQRLYALLDIAEDEAEQAVIGGKNQQKYYKQILALENQIAAAEKKLFKIRFDGREAAKKLQTA